MRQYFLILLVLFLSYSGQAQSLLWKISGNGLSKPSYLYGTMHVQDERAFRFNDSVLVVFDRTDAVVNEMLLDSIEPLKLLAAMTLDSGKTLHDYLSDKQYKRLEKKFNKSTGLDLETYKTLRPVMISAFMSENQFNDQMGVALDMYFQQRGKSQSKSLFGLETYAEQLHALTDIPMKEQITMLFSKTPSTKADKKSTDKMLALYNKADLDALYKWSMADEQGTEFENGLLTERNSRMADRIVPIIQSHSAFIAIGALHLPGADGVISHLRQKGFTVEPVGGPAKDVPRVGLPGADKSDSTPH